VVRELIELVREALSERQLAPSPVAA